MATLPDAKQISSVKVFTSVVIFVDFPLVCKGTHRSKHPSVYVRDHDKLHSRALFCTSVFYRLWSVSEEWDEQEGSDVFKRSRVKLVFGPGLISFPLQKPSAMNWKFTTV